MTRREVTRYGVWSALAASFIVFVIVEPTGILRGIARREAFHHSRPSSYWRQVFREEGKNGGLSEATIKEFTDGPYGISVLKECYQDTDPSVRENSILLLWSKTYGEGLELFLANALNDESENVQLAAAERLGELGTPARELAHSKLATLTNSTDANIATEAIRNLWWTDPEVALKAKPWYKFESAKWQVTAMLPAKPEESYKEIPSALGTLKAYGYCTPEDQPWGFGVYVYQVPPDVEQTASVQKRYSAIAEISTKQFKEAGKKNAHMSKRRVDISGHEGIAIDADDGEKLRLHERVVLLGSRGYAFLVGETSDYPLSEQELDYFFNSCQVTYSANEYHPEDEAEQWAKD